ncbi:MAG: protein of unknown function with transrane region [Candidatus Parcubacteria bacterium]|nr:protein of unknown function with transrane region [Candidatus Parcubacteria bacterium]
MPSEERNRIEDLKQSLYSRNAPELRTRRKLRTSSPTSDIKTDWEHPQAELREDPVLTKEYESPHSMSFFTKLLLWSAAFCVIAVAGGAYLFLNGANLISADNINITISGPVSVPGGVPITFGITIINKNSVVLKGADLRVRFPAGTTDPNDTTRSMDNYQESIGDIAPGNSVTKNVQAVIFGEQNLQKQITATVTYGIAGSSSVFNKVQTYDVMINSSPVVLSATSFDKITSGQPFDITVDVKSNASNVLKKVLLTAQYPFGYTYASSNVAPVSADNNVWTLGDIPAGATRKIVIHGSLSGENTDLRAFHFSVGAQGSGSTLGIGTPYMEAEKDVTIEKPFISLAIGVNSDSGTGDYAGQFGRAINVGMHWQNNLPESLSNVNITAHLSGNAYNKGSVNPVGGYFRSATDDIVWSQQTDPQLATVSSGASGNLTFVVTPTDTGTPSNPLVNPSITIAGSVTGIRGGASNAPNNTAQVTRTIKIASTASLSGRILRSGGPFTNTGPIPPRADQKTTYTVVWTVDNTSNALQNAVVTATLPPYVSWLGKISPSAENMKYDANSSTVTWNVGTVGTYTSGTNKRREVQFQISVQPSVSQIGQSPTIVNQATLNATDSWTNTTLTNTQGTLSTSFSTDSSFRNGDGTVQGK